MFNHPETSKVFGCVDTDTYKEKTRRYARGEHVMSKAEGSLMRRIQSETGLSEEEVRTHKKYRKMLSDTQKSGSSLSSRLWKPGPTPLEEKWSWGSPKAMFMQKACEVLDNDKEAAARLYKRYAGGLIDMRHPSRFYYRSFSLIQNQTEILKAIDKTDGMFVFDPQRNEVGFAYESSLTMFSLVYTAI